MEKEKNSLLVDCGEEEETSNYNSLSASTSLTLDSVSSPRDSASPDARPPTPRILACPDVPKQTRCTLCYLPDTPPLLHKKLCNIVVKYRLLQNGSRISTLRALWNRIHPLTQDDLIAKLVAILKNEQVPNVDMMGNLILLLNSETFEKVLAAHDLDNQGLAPYMMLRLYNVHCKLRYTHVYDLCIGTDDPSKIIVVNDAIRRGSHVSRQRSRREHMVTPRIDSSSSINYQNMSHMYWKLMQTRQINISYTKLPAGTIPPAVTNIANLQILAMNNCSLGTLHSSIGLLRQLHTLEITDNEIEALPDELSALTLLQYFNANRNKIRSIHNIYFENMQALEEIKLASNALTSLPDKLYLLPNLTSLDVSSNNLEAFPDTLIESCSLSYLSVSNNKKRLDIPLSHRSSLAIVK